MRITRRFTKQGQDALASVEYEKRTSRITNPDGSVVFEMHDALIPRSWSQLATDIMVSKYFRKAGVPQVDAAGEPIRDAAGNIVTGPERSAAQVVHRLAGCWRYWGEKYGYFDTAEDAQAFYDELVYMLLHQMCAPNSPQWFNTGLNFAYGITGPSQGHFYCDPRSGELLKAKDAYSHPQPHACQPYDALVSTPQGPIRIGDIVSKNLVGLEVYDGTAEGRGTTRVVAVKANGEKPVFRIVLKNGVTVEATPDHLVWVSDERRTRGEWRRVDAIRPGMRLHLSTATTVSKPSSVQESREAALAGWLQGDGFVGQYAEGTNRSLTVEFMTVDQDEFDFVIGLVAQVFEGVHHHVSFVESESPELDIRRIRLYGEQLRGFVDKYELLRRGSDLAVPSVIRTLGRDAQAAYLRALFQADGTVRLRSRDSNTADVVLTTTSLALARGVQSLLMNLGIYARVQRGVEKRDGRRTPYFVSIGYAEARARFRDTIGFVSAVKAAKLAAACAGPFVGRQLPDVREEMVLRVESIGVEPVYDIQTESGQYLSNNIIVHNCFIQSVHDDLVNPGGIMDLWVREARLFKYGSGTGTNFSKLRGENEPLSGGGKSSGLMSFLRIGDRAAGAIKSGGTTRRAAKMVCLDLDHPDIEAFINWKVREELKVAAMAEGIKVLPRDQRELARKLGLKLDYDFNGEAYYTVSGQNSNNSVRVPNRFMHAVEEDGEWNLTARTSGKVCKTLKARDLWEQIAFAAWRCADPGVQYDDTINQWHTCPQSGRINASNPCVTGDTRVLCPGGIWRRIDQMIHLPGRIVTNLTTQAVHRTEGAFPTGVREVFELRTVGGYVLRLTADHQVYTRNRGWVAAKDLTALDQVKLPSQPACVEAIGEPQDPRLFQLLGLFLSSANGDPGALHLDAALPDPRLVDEFAHYIAENWGQRTYDDDYVDQRLVHEEELDESGNTLTVKVTNRRLMSRLGAFIRNDGGRRRLGDDIFTAGLPAQKHLLRGLFSADGVIRDGALELLSDNLPLLEDVQLLLLGFGVQSSLFAGDEGTEARRHEGGEAVPTGNWQLPTGNSSPPIENRKSKIEIAQHSALSTQHSGPTDRGELSERRAVPTWPGDQTRPGGVSADRDAALDSAVWSGAESRRHGLRIDSGSLRLFATHIGLLPGLTARRLAETVARCAARPEGLGNFDRVATLRPLGRRQVFDLAEPVTHSFIANGLTVHNCSEYMFLDDTACNLASLNVLAFFDPETRRFDIEAYRHAIRLWTVVLEISVLMASFPSEQIARLSYRFRTLGLGYANLGAMLMQAGIAYDSDKARAVCAALSAILSGEAYATSAELAREHGAFAGFEENRADMLRVIRNHRRAAYDVGRDPAARQRLGDYEALEIRPVGIDASQFSDADPLASPALLRAARECWDRALALGERFGYRNAQVSVIAPTGTIGLLMDCDTTGVEPDFALVKFKKLAGGGYFKIANQSLRPALANLGYSPQEIHEIIRYVMGTMSLENAPHINRVSLKSAGLSDEDLDRIEQALPGVFELSFAFSPWVLGKEAMARLGLEESVWQAEGFSLLAHLGFSRRQIAEANDVICGRGTVEGAPHLRPEHYAVFDCANRCGRLGRRFISVEGHIRMMAAAQPFISGAISKTINLPAEASVQDIKNAYFLSWKLGLKATALYRDGSKLSQPLNVKSDQELEKATDGDDDDAVAAAREEVAADVARAAQAALRDTAESSPSKLEKRKPAVSDNLAPATTTPIEKIIERIVERPLRRRLPDTRKAVTHKFDVGGHEGYVTVGLYDDGSPGEVFITMAKEGSTIGGLMDTIATLVSLALQYGVPVESLVKKFEHVRFEPSGMTRNPEIPFAKSLVDYIFRWLAMEFVPGYRSANAPRRAEKRLGTDSAAPPAAEASTGPALPQAPEASRPRHDRGGNGHGHAEQRSAEGPTLELHPQLDSSGHPASMRLVVSVDPLSQQGSELQADAPACDVCGAITVRSGTCYKCLNCGNSMGCS